MKRVTTLDDCLGKVLKKQPELKDAMPPAAITRAVRNAKRAAKASKDLKGELVNEFTAILRATEKDLAAAANAQNTSMRQGPGAAQRSANTPESAQRESDPTPGFQHLVIDRDLEAGFMSGAGADALIDLAHRAFAAGRTFAQWAAAMVQRFGAAVRDYLAGVWDHAKRSSQTGALNFTSRLGEQLQQASQQAARPAATDAPLEAAKPPELGERWWATTTRAEARSVLEPAALEELKAIAVRMDENPNQPKEKLIDRLVQITGVYADAVGIRGADAVGPRGTMPDYTGQAAAAQQRMREQRAARAQQPKERGLPKKAKPRTPEEFARDMAALMARPATGDKQINLSAAYASALRGSSTAMVPIKDVYQQALTLDPTLTVDRFMAEVQAGDNAGTVLLEGSGSLQEAQAAPLRIDGTPVGTAVRMMVVGDPALQNPASGASRAAGGTLASAPSPGGLNEVEVPKGYVIEGNFVIPIHAPQEQLRGETRLYRAQMSEDGYAEDGESFSEEIRTADAYRNNSGFGGPHLFAFDVDTSRALKVDGMLDLSKRISGNLPEDVRDWMETRGFDSPLDAWRDYGFGYTHDPLHSKWGPKGFSLQQHLREQGYDWLIFEDEVPANAITHWLLKEVGLEGAPVYDLDSLPQKSPTAEGPVSSESAIAGVNSNGAAVRQGDSPPSAPEGNPESSRAADGTLNSAPSPGGLSEAIVSIFNPVFRLDDARLNNRQTSGRTEGIGAWMSPGGNIAGLNKFSSHNLAAYAILHGEDIPNSVKRLTKELSTLLQSRLGEKFVVNVDIKNGPATYKESGFRTYIEAESKNHFLAEPDDFSADEMPLIVKLNELAIRLDSTFSDDTKYYDEIQRRGWVRLVKENQTLHAQSVGKLKVAQRRNLTDLALYHGWKLEIEELPSFESSRDADGTLNAAPAPRYQSPPGLADTAQRLKGTTAAPSLVGTIIQKAYAGVQRGRSSVMVPIRAVWMVAKAAHPELTPAGFMEQINAMNDTGTALIGLSETREAVAAAGPFRVGAAGTEMAMMPQSAGETITSLPPSSFTDFIPEDLQRARSDRAKLTPAQIAGEQPTNDPVLGLRTANGGLRLLDGYHRYLAALEHGWNLPVRMQTAQDGLASAPSPGGLSEAESRKILSEARKKRTELESHYTSDAHDVWSESDARENLESELDREPSPEEVADYIAKSQRQHNDEVKELLWEHGTTINHLVWQQIAENALTSLGVKSDGYSNKSEASYWYLPGATAQNGDALGDAYRIRVASHDPVYTQSDTLVQYDLREILDDNHALEAAIESVNDLKKEITKLNPSFESSRAADGALNAAPAPGNRNAKLVASLPADVVAAAQRIVSTGAVSAADADTLKQSAVASLLDTADAAATVDNLRDLLGVADDSYDRQYAQGSQAVDRAFANRAALKSLAARVHREKTLSAADEQWIRENAPMYVGKTRDATLRNVSRFYVNTLVGTDAPRAADGTLNSAPSPGGLSEAEWLERKTTHLSEYFPEEIEAPELEKIIPDTRSKTEFEYQGKEFSAIRRDRTLFIQNDEGETIRESRLIFDFGSGDLALTEEDVYWNDPEAEADFEDIWQAVPDDLYAGDYKPSNIEKDDIDTWREYYALRTFFPGEGWEEKSRHSTLADALKAYYDNDFEGRVEYFTGATERVRDGFGENAFWENVPISKVVIEADFEGKLAREFPGMDKETAASIAKSRNPDNDDPFLVAQAWARHNLTGYDDILSEAGAFTGDGRASDFERSAARREIRERVDLIIKKWKTATPVSQSDGFDVKGVQRDSQIQPGRLAASEPIPEAQRVVGTWPKKSKASGPEVNPSSSRAAGGALASAPRPVSAAQDAEYMAAVESGDVAKQRAMVDAAAKAADVTYVAKIPVERIIRSSLPGVNRPLSDGVAAPIILERTGRNGEKFALVDGYHRLDGMIDKGETFVTAIILNDKDSRALEDNSSREIERVQSEHKGESADPITRDAEGNVIPLSERFNPESDSILRSAPRPDDAKAKAIKEAIATMPPYWREALELSMQGTPPAEIAQKMQRSETAVGHLLNVANGRLRFLLAAAEGKLKPIVQVEDGIVKAKRGRPDLAMSGNALMAALDQQMGDSEVVHRAEMRELADTMFTGWPAETLALVKRWMDSGGIMLSPQNLPDGLRKIIEEASARGAGDMLMQAAANHALNEARFNNAPMIEQAALGLAQRFNGGVQARAFGMRQDTIHNPMERHALYIQKALLAPSDEVERSLKKNPEMRERYLAQLVADAEAMKKHLKGLGMDIDAWFAELKEIKAEGEAMIPQEAQKPLARMPEKQREGIKAVLQGATWAEAAANFKLPVGELIGAYTALFDSVNRIGVEAAQAAKNAALAAAPAMSFAEQVGLPRPPTGNIDPNSRLVDTPKSRQHQAKKAKAALSNPKKVAAAIQEVTVGRAGWIDKASEYWRMSILTGPQTWVVNASSGVTFGFYRHLVQKLGSAGLAGLARMIGVKDMEDAPALSDMPHIISAAIKAWKPSLRLAMRSMRHNARLFNMYADGTLGIDPGAEKWDAKEAGLKVNEQGNYANEKFDPALSREHWFGKTMDALSFRILLLADEFVRSFFGRIEMAGQARQLARSEPRLRARAVELEAKARAVLAGKNYTLKWSGGDGHYYATEQVQRVDGSTSTERVTWAEWRKVLPDSMRESLAIMGRDLYLHGGLDAMLSKMDGEALEKRIEQLTKPDSVAWHRAVEGANTFTFQNKIGEGKRLIDGLDAFAKIIMDAKKGKYGWLKHPANFVFPFVATPLNIFKTGVTMSPVGGLFAVMDAVRAYRLRKQGGLEQADKIMNAQRGLEEMVNQIVAWGLVLVIADMVEPGDDDEGLPLMTGTTPYTITSQGEREIAYRTAPPQSIRLFGRWFSYARLDPFGSVLANIADSVLAFRSEQPSDVAMGELGIKMVRSIKDKTFLQGLSDVLNAVQDPERFFPRWFTNIATGFIPNLIRQPIRSADPLIREGDLAKDMGFWESFGRRVGYSVVPQSAMPAVSVWGQDENKNTGMGGPASDFVMRLLWPGQTRGTEGVDYIDAALYRYNQTHDKAFGVTAPSREIPKIINGKPVRVSLDDAEYDEMTRKAGQAARIAIGDRFKGRDLTETDVDLIKAIISREQSAYRDAAFAQAFQKRGLAK